MGGGGVMSLLQWMGKAERGELGLGTSLQVQCGGWGMSLIQWIGKHSYMYTVCRWISIMFK